ncbi:hypothetical protein STEG23_032956 [Scotinomys teguina]
MEVVAAAPRFQLLLILLMAAMLLPGMKSLPLFVQRKIARTIELQRSIGKVAGISFPGLYSQEEREDFAIDGTCLQIRQIGLYSTHSKDYNVQYIYNTGHQNYFITDLLTKIKCKVNSETGYEYESIIKSMNTQTNSGMKKTVQEVKTELLQTTQTEIKLEMKKVRKFKPKPPR